MNQPRHLKIYGKYYNTEISSKIKVIAKRLKELVKCLMCAINLTPKDNLEKLGWNFF